MEIKLNGTSMDVVENCSLKQLLFMLNERWRNAANEASGRVSSQNRAFMEGAYALAVNEQFVPRARYDSLIVNAGDKIELLVPMQGG